MVIVFAEHLTDVRVDHSPGTFFSNNSVSGMQGQQAENSLNRYKNLMLVMFT